MQDSLTEQLESLGVDFMLRSLSDTLDADINGISLHKVFQLSFCNGQAAMQTIVESSHRVEF